MTIPASGRSTAGMVRPGRDLAVTVQPERALAVIGAALAARGLAPAPPGKADPEGALRYSSGSTGKGVLVEAVSSAVPLWLVPGLRRHLLAFDVRARVTSHAAAAAGASLRLDLDRRAAAAVVDAQFHAALDAVDAALAAEGILATWGDLTDSARERGR